MVVGRTIPFAVSDLRERPDLIRLVAGWVHGQWSWLSGRTPEQTLQRFQPTANGALPVSLVALQEGKPVGVASLRQFDDVVPVRDVTPWLTNMFVPAAARGKGVATVLVAAVCAEARSRGFAEVWLATDDQQSLYQRCGFQQRRQVIVGKSHADVMSKKLS
jgi:GNAT superfamily N-acetyltransferase